MSRGIYDPIDEIAASIARSTAPADGNTRSRSVLIDVRAALPKGDGARLRTQVLRDRSLAKPAREALDFLVQGLETSLA